MISIEANNEILNYQDKDRHYNSLLRLKITIF